MGKRSKKKPSSHGPACKATESKNTNKPIELVEETGVKPKTGNNTESNFNPSDTSLNHTAIKTPTQTEASLNKDKCAMEAPPIDLDGDKEVLKNVSSQIKNSDKPITLKDLMSAITRAASDRKKAAGSSKKDSELKEELGSLLRQIKMEGKMQNSSLASEKPLSNEEGLSEILHLLNINLDSYREGKPTVADTSPSITESLLDSTSKVKNVTASSSTESDDVKEESGTCKFCELDATTKCTGCRKVFYCSRDCQKSHWSIHKDTCRSYKVGRSEGFGRVLVATRAIAPHEEVLRERPFVVGPRGGDGNVCMGCFRRVFGLYRCPVCRWPLCGPSCITCPRHVSAECRLSAASELSGSEELRHQTTEVAMVLRCLVASREDPSRWASMLDRFGGRHRLRGQRMGGAGEGGAGELLQHLRSSFKLHEDPQLSRVTDEEITTVLSVLQVHSIPSRSPFGDVSGIFPMASMLGHSCVPNTKTRLQGEHLVVTASEEIPAGSPLTALFTDLLWGTKARRDHLLQSRYFACCCRRCSDPTELGSYFSALICPKCTEKQLVLPTNPLVAMAPWACRACCYQVSGEEAIETTLTLGSEVAEQLAKPNIQGLEDLLEKWLTRVHTNHYHLHAIKHSLLQLYCRDADGDELPKHEAYWNEIAKKEKTCQEFLKVCSLLDPSMAHSVPQFGLAFYELHKTVFQYAKRNFGLAKLGTQQLKKKMQLAKALLRRSMDILQHEAEDTPEGQLHSRCQEEFIEIGKWMLSVGLI